MNLINILSKYIQSNPEALLDNIFTAINTLICGLIVAYFTSTFLKKKEERTRIAGVIVEKRLNSEQEILHFLEKALFKEELNIDNDSRNDLAFLKLLDHYNLPVPYEKHFQYAKIFLSRDAFSEFYHELEDKIMTHKLWLDDKVKEHLVFIQIYFDVFNIIPLMIKRIPLPEGRTLSDKEFANVDKRLLLLLGASFDGEINMLMSELDEKIIDSVYKLDLGRPRRSIQRDGLYNVDMAKLQKRLMKKCLIGIHQLDIFSLVKDLVYQEKGINPDAMSDEEYDEFMKETMSEEDYNDIIQDAEQFKKEFEEFAKKKGIKIVSKEELNSEEGKKKYAGMYGISLKDALEGKEPEKFRDDIKSNKK